MNNELLFRNREYFSQFLELNAGVLIWKSIGLPHDMTKKEITVDGKSYAIMSILKALKFKDKPGHAPRGIKSSTALVLKIDGKRYKVDELKRLIDEKKILHYVPLLASQLITIDNKKYRISDITQLIKSCDLPTQPPIKSEPITHEMIKLLVRYAPETGFLFWKKRGVEYFNGNVGLCDQWNVEHEGKEAFAGMNNEYKAGAILGRRKQAAHVVWFVNHGKWPELPLSYVDSDTMNNRIENLVYKGVFLNGDKQWQAEVKAGKGFRYLNIHNNFQDAVDGKIAFLAGKT